MRWKDEFKIGIPLIDTQHKQLFRFNDELEESIQKGLKVSDISSLLIQIKQYIVRHFVMEEKYMQEIKYPSLDEQKEAHAAFTAKFQELQDMFNEEGMSGVLVDKIHNELIAWVTSHVTGMDQAIGDFYKSYCSNKE